MFMLRFNVKLVCCYGQYSQNILVYQKEDATAAVVLVCGNRLSLRMCMGFLLINYSNNLIASHFRATIK